ncbi:TenA family transcriptional regulator [Caballeronia zhejiangensis]|uniref:TenA family transcriptional regulator n=1 Tax=Caballeronia zhejiangensis TaxID=871203 RepID=UPI001FD1D73F|nr:iron-containing redox enzyme family protein [Caballeronia zhejiangensis]
MLDPTFQRVGDLKDIATYPARLGDVLNDTNETKQTVISHPIFAAMREAKLTSRQAEAFLVNGWPVVEQFPQYMPMNLQKLRYGHSRGEDLARRYLTCNIRVEQNHADYWVDWATAHGVNKRALMKGGGPSLAYALSHWCWKSSSGDPLAASIAATNFAIEGVTGEWSTLVCSSDTYANSFPTSMRRKAMRWPSLHAHYDDAHPWEALEIVATLLGNAPGVDEVHAVKRSIDMSYEYFKLSLDCCL